MQVFDLTRLRGVTEPQTWTEDAHYSFSLDGHRRASSSRRPREPLNPPDNAHNIAINEESGLRVRDRHLDLRRRRSAHGRHPRPEGPEVRGLRRPRTATRTTPSA